MFAPLIVKPQAKTAVRPKISAHTRDERGFGKIRKFPEDRAAEALRSPGQPLDAATRAKLEPRFGQDFSGVRVHTDQAAIQSARVLDAKAFTRGQDIAFGAGRFAPATQEGLGLLAHELVHVVQQRRGGAIPPLWGSAAHEQEASRAVVAVLSGQGLVPITSGTGLGLARQHDPGDEDDAGRLIAQSSRLRRDTEGLRTVANDLLMEEGIDTLKNPRALRATKELHLDQTIRDLRRVARSASSRASEAGRIADELEALKRDAREVGAKLRDLKRYSKAGAASGTSATATEATPEGRGSPSERSGGAKVEDSAGKIESEAAGAGKVEGTLGKVESKIVGGAEGSVGKLAGLGAKAGRLSAFLIELALPGPQDVLFLWIGFFGSLAEAKEKLRNESYSLGFSEGIAARLLGVPADEATRMLIKPDTSRGSIGEQVAGFSGVTEHGSNLGALAGWKFAGNLGDPQRAGFLKVGFDAIIGQGKRIGPHVEPGTPKEDIPNFNQDDVIILGVALKPTVDELLEVARKQEEARREEEEAKKYLEFQDAVLRYGPKE